MSILHLASISRGIEKDDKHHCHIDTNPYDSDLATCHSRSLKERAIYDFRQALTGPITIRKAASFSCSNNLNICPKHPESMDVYADRPWNGDFGTIDLTSTDWTLPGSLSNGTAQGGDVLSANGTYAYPLLIDCRRDLTPEIK